MPVLGAQKQTLLNQVKNQTAVPLQTLVDLVNRYDDLEAGDFQGYVDGLLLEQLYDACRDPREVALWNQIANYSFTRKEDIQQIIQLATTYINSYPNGYKAQEVSERLSKARNILPIIDEEIDWSKIKEMPVSTTQEKQNVQRQISSFLDKYKNGVHARDAQELMNSLQKEINEQIEQRDWDMVERGNYNALQTYKSKYPSSVHMDEIDDLMWLNTKNVMNFHSLSRYLSDWPLGRHAEEAKQALSESSEWEEVKRSGDIFRVDDFRDNHPTSPYINEVNALYYKLRDEELAKMKENPSEYSKDDVIKLISADIFTRWELEDEGLLDWEKIIIDRDIFPNIQDFMIENPNIKATEGCTDVYLFGTPGTGKTCLLMGLTGANGQGYTLNMKTHGGAYAAALQEYVNAGLTPGPTFGKFVTTINGQISETDKRDNVISHRIN
ncbi:MAG: hypothetical protein J5965_18490, partial [Aeriscardovia sp.]|nr:hypothetical protein [Aeriscardovia sp.]